MKKPTIYFDMDGVLADFFNPAFAACNEALCFGATADDYRRSHGKFSIEEYFRITPRKFWGIIDSEPGFWECLPVLRQGVSAFNEYAADPRFDVYVLTSPSANPHCIYGKAVWLQKHLGVGVKRVIYTGNKHLLAHPGALLIDDYPKNTMAFANAGGATCLLPADWAVDTSQLDLVSIIRASAESFYYSHLQTPHPIR